MSRGIETGAPCSIVGPFQEELLAIEVAFQNSVSRSGRFSCSGPAIGFIVGMMISYQILYTDLSDHAAIRDPEGHGLRIAISYGSCSAGELLRLIGFLPAWGSAFCSTP